jgi:hypothetical protein
MTKETQRWAAAALGFAAAVMWTTVGAGAALTCLLAAGLCAGAAFVRESGSLGVRLIGAVAGAKRLAQAAVPTPPPARAPRQQPRRRPKPQPEREQRRPEPEPAPLLPPYDHDVPSGEHVYEVANYGW